MKSSNLFARALLGAGLLVLGGAGAAHAQQISPVAPVFPTAPPLPGDRCTVEAVNLSGLVNPDGSMFIPNVPVGTSQINVRAICTDLQGATYNGASATFTPTPGGVSYVTSGVSFAPPVPIASRLTISPPTLMMNGLGSTSPITVTGVLPDGGTTNLTAAIKTKYTTSNAAVATIDNNGNVLAIGPGNALITATNEGASGVGIVRVRTAALTSLDVTPTSATLSRNLAISSQPVSLRTLGVLADGTTLDLSAAAAGTTYTSSNTSIAVVTPDGALLGVAGGSATITVQNGGVQAQVPVTVNAFTPSPIAAYNTPGFAYNVDVAGSLIFVADGSAGLQIHSTTSPTVVGKLAFPGFEALSVKVRTTLAAVALGAGGVALVDVSIPSQPTQIHRITSIATARDVWISGNWLFVASSDGLRVYNVTNPAAPTPVGAGSALGFNATAVAGDSTRGVAVVLTTDSLVRVFRITAAAWSQANPPLSLPGATNPVDDVVINGVSAYVAHGSQGLHKVDLSSIPKPKFDPDNPRTNVNLQVSATGVAVQSVEGRVLVAAADQYYQNAALLFNDRLTGTANVDFSNAPGMVNPAAEGTGVALGDGFGVVSVGADGIQLFRTREIIDNGGSPPTVSLTSPTANSGLVSGSLSLMEATAVDDVGVSYVEFFVDNTSVGFDTSAPFSREFSPGSACSTQTLRATAIDDYGNIGQSLPVPIKVQCAAGQPCAINADCVSNTCAGGVCQAGPCSLTYSSCAALKLACPGAASGTYPIDPDGAGPTPSFQTYCDMARAGGGWTLVAKMTNQDAKNWVNAASSWTGTNFYGNTQDLSTGQDAKSRAWGTLPVSNMMLTDNPNPLSGQLVMTNGGCFQGMTLSAFFTAALAGYPTANGQSYYRQCTTTNTYIPGWTYEPNWIDPNPESQNNSLVHGYLTIARSDESDTYAVISFYRIDELLFGPGYDPVIDATGELEADVGLAASERNGFAFGTTGDAQDIGGPLSCNLTDAMCRSDYPQTVFVFAR